MVDITNKMLFVIIIHCKNYDKINEPVTNCKNLTLIIATRNADFRK
jgi:hypothetical protein